MEDIEFDVSAVGLVPVQTRPIGLVSSCETIPALETFDEDCLY